MTDPQRVEALTRPERAAALETVAAEVRSCTRCRLHATRTKAVPGEGDPETEVVFVGEGPGFNEDRAGRPFVGRAGELLERHLASIGWRRDDVFITNVVKCRPPDNRDPEPDEIAACYPYLRLQLEILDPALLVTLGRHSMGRFLQDARISRDHGTLRAVDPATGARDALVFPMFHPAAALRSPDVARQSEADIRAVPAALLEARGRRASRADAAPATRDLVPVMAAHAAATPAPDSSAEHAPEEPHGRAPERASEAVAVGAVSAASDLGASPPTATGDPARTSGHASTSDPASPSDPADQMTLF